MFNFGQNDEGWFAVITKCKMPVLHFADLSVSLTLIDNTVLTHFQRDKEKNLFPDCRLHRILQASAIFAYQQMLVKASQYSECK